MLSIRFNPHTAYVYGKTYMDTQGKRRIREREGERIGETRIWDDF